MQMKRNHKIALLAIIPAVLFGGFFMADMFTTSDSSVPIADATALQPEPTVMGEGISFVPNENGGKDITVELFEELTMTDSVTVTTSGATSP